MWTAAVHGTVATAHRLPAPESGLLLGAQQGMLRWASGAAAAGAGALRGPSWVPASRALQLQAHLAASVDDPCPAHPLHPNARADTARMLLITSSLPSCCAPIHLLASLLSAHVLLFAILYGHQLIRHCCPGAAGAAADEAYMLQRLSLGAARALWVLPQQTLLVWVEGMMIMADLGWRASRTWHSTARHSFMVMFC